MNSFGLQTNSEINNLKVNNFSARNITIESKLLGTYFYILYDPETEKKNYSSKSTTQYQNQDKTITERNYESYRLGQYKLNGENKKNIIIKITGTNVYTSSKSTIQNDSNILRFDTETIEIKDNQDTVIGHCIYNDGILENTSTVTNAESLKFTVLGGTGKFRNANFIIIIYMNNDSFDSTNKNLFTREIQIFS